MEFTAEAREVEHVRLPSPNKRNNKTSINHPTSMFQLFEVFLLYVWKAWEPAADLRRCYKPERLGLRSHLTDVVPRPATENMDIMGLP